jgi:hypothetical protein
MKFNLITAHYLGNALYEGTLEAPLLIDFDDPRYGMKTKEGDYSPPSLMMQPADTEAKEFFRKTFPHLRDGVKPLSALEQIEIKPAKVTQK